MNANECRTALQNLISQVAPDVDVDSLDPAVDLRRAADLDSLDFQSLVELVAGDLGVEIPEMDYPQVRSLQGMSEYVAAHTA